MQKVYKLTNQRLEELKNELNFLRTVREKEVADQIKEARSFGDLSENSEYDEAKNEQGKLYSRIAEIENILSNVEIIPDAVDTTVVTLGCKVDVIDLSDDSREAYYVVGSQEANPSQLRISDESPFGKALLGKKVGDTAVFSVNDNELKYKVVEISK